MFRGILTLTLSLCLGAVAAPAPAQAAPITEQEAHAVAVDAYVYFYSLLSVDITRKQFTNIEPGKEILKGPMITFSSAPEYPPANFKGVVRTNFDTLYSSAWLDMSKEPVVISLPDTNGRYYLMPILDMWSDVFASPGWRTTGTQAGTFLITPQVGGRICATGSPTSSSFRRTPSASKRRRRMHGSSAVPRRTVRRTMTRFIKSRPATRSPCFPILAKHPSRSNSSPTPAST